MKYIKPLILLILIIISPNISDASENIINQLKEGGKVIFIRHGFAPGNGDPDNFLVNDCSTQRNLDKNGINQSRKIGKLFKKNKIPVDTVLSSEWCRCKDTAFYAFKDFETKSFLNSFYDIKFQKNKNRQIKQLKDYIKKWNGKKNLILITHYVVINEILKINPSSGEMIISDNEFNIIGKLENKL